MATAKEYGIIPNQPLPVDIIDEVIQSPSDEWYRAYTQRYHIEHEGKIQPASTGRYVRVDNELLMAPFIGHIEICKAALVSEVYRRRFLEAMERQKQEWTAIPTVNGPMRSPVLPDVALSDAGVFVLSNDIPELDLLIIGQPSTHFYPASDGQRHITKQLLEEKIPSVEVDLTELN